jgi:hypothetical protein
MRRTLRPLQCFLVWPPPRTPYAWQTRRDAPSVCVHTHVLPVPSQEDFLVFGLRFRTHHQTLVVLALLAGSKAGCSEAAKPNQLGFGVGFVCEEDRVESSLLRLRVLVDGCDEDSETLYEASVGRGEAAPPIDNLGPGRYGVEATAYAEDDMVVARACLEVSLPRSEAIRLELRSTACVQEPLDAGPPMDMDAEIDADGENDAETSDPDAQGEADADPADAEQEPDAGPVVCSSDCSDSDPCTDDLCVAGACTHQPFSGARECDGIACTQGDTCVAGECQPGAPDDAACADDGNACTAEVCVAGAGCNRSNAGADGRSCNDNIGCTSSDTCNNGVCSGADNCPSGQVCSASRLICVACTSPADCDDGNPCTTDTCNASNGQCGHSNNTASCNDGKSCTGSDVCAAGRCAGTSTCPSDATCGGSTCSCTDGSETLCSASNTCVNLTNAASDCGLCGRSCGSGNSCQNGACKPSAASACTAYRNGGHDYLVCNDTLSWTAARDRCRSFGLVLAIVDSQSENDFLRDRLGGAARWLGANDRGTNGNSCRLSSEEGTWYWANGSSDNGTRFCTATASGAVSCNLVTGLYQNWNFGEPNNGSCTCNFQGCTDGQDCASIDPPNGTWDDDLCTAALGYICETP